MFERSQPPACVGGAAGRYCAGEDAAANAAVSCWPRGGVRAAVDAFVEVLPEEELVPKRVSGVSREGLKEPRAVGSDVLDEADELGCRSMAGGACDGSDAGG
ncbi:hypothetical protein HK101_004054, partial [Irineochytrium annulatum]